MAASFPILPSAQDTDTPSRCPAMAPSAPRSKKIIVLSCETAPFKALLQSAQRSLANRQDPAFPSIPKQKKDLEHQVQVGIAPYRYDRVTRPPFSFPEMIVMGLVSCGWKLCKSAIHFWILQYFGYYRNLAMVHTSGYGGPKAIKRAGEVYSEFCSAFNSLETPIIHRTALNARDQDRVMFASSSDEGYWLAGPFVAVCLCIRRSLAKRSDSSPPFGLMRLPPELRLCIYEYALLFPKSGVQLSYEGRRGAVSLHAFSKDYDRSPTRVPTPNHLWGFRLPRRLDCPPPSTHLALLSVSKTVFKEAMPVFYGDNLLVCDKVADLHRLLSQLPEDRRDHLRHIAFSISPQCKSIATKAFKLLAALPRLSELDIWIYEPSFRTEKTGYVGLPGFLLPGFPQLRKVRGLKAVRFHGVCDTVKEALAVEMMKPKKEQKKDVLRKRKAVSLTETNVKKAKLS